MLYFWAFVRSNQATAPDRVARWTLTARVWSCVFKERASPRVVHAEVRACKVIEIVIAEIT